MRDKINLDDLIKIIVVISKSKIVINGFIYSLIDSHDVWGGCKDCIFKDAICRNVRPGNLCSYINGGIPDDKLMYLNNKMRLFIRTDNIIPPGYIFKDNANISIYSMTYFKTHAHGRCI